LDALAVAMISSIGCVDRLPAAAWETDGGRTVASWTLWFRGPVRDPPLSDPRV